MLFSSYTFVFVFLPLTLAVLALALRIGGARAGLAAMIAVSFAFYSFSGPAYLLLLIGSIIFNYGAGQWADPRSGRPARRAMLITGIAVNLAVIGFFKYTNFFGEIAQQLTGYHWAIHVALPLGVSFYTFQQIAYLVDCYRGRRVGHGLADYLLFVSFFPQLIAGPIVHHRQILPQIHRGRLGYRPRSLATGLMFFTLGLAKKVLVADPMGTLADPVFEEVSRGQALAAATAWTGTLAYSLQIYFDFSAYSDMAVGLAFMMGLRLPFNFNSPYQATSIIDFWRRWHITLSAFLRDYLYIPLGGGRRGAVHRSINLMITMLLGGLWHGANWTFVAWGGIHGLYLMVNHAWRRICPPPAPRGAARATLAILGGRAATFLAVVWAWVVFRTESFDAAWRMWSSMLGAAGAAEPAQLALSDRKLALLSAMLLVVWLAPNTQAIVFAIHRHIRAGAWRVAPRHWRPRPETFWGATMALLFVAAVLHLSRINEFIYFRF